MIEIIPNPDNVPGAVSTGYQRQNTLLYASSVGHMNIGIVNKDNLEAPQIMAGSVFELNGMFYKCSANEPMSGSTSNNVVNYIYAIPNAGSATFQYGTTKPTFFPEKGGWYNGNNRAIALLFMNNGAYYGKRIIKDLRDELIPDGVGKVSSGGTLVASVSGNEKKDITLEKGFYRIEIAGSKGGDGGEGNVSGGIGGYGGYIKTQIYNDHKTYTVVIFSAKQGEVGQTGGYGDGSDNPNGVVGGGGGGGGGTGAFIIDEMNIGLYAFGGGGGGGGGGTNSGSANNDNGGSGGSGGGGSGENGIQGGRASEYGRDPVSGGYILTTEEGIGKEGGIGGTKSQGGYGGTAGPIPDNITLPSGGAGGGIYYSLNILFPLQGGKGGKGGNGEDAIYTPPYNGQGGPTITSGGNGEPGGNSVDSTVGNAPSADGFVRVYKVA
jgi:hypothetical protein